MKIAVTGGAGFIGSHLADALLAEGHEVRIIDNGGSYAPKAAKLIKLDINSPELKKHFEGCETVFHFAADPDVKGSAEKPEPSFRNNVLGTFNVLEACRNASVKNIVFASTSTVYGENVPVPTPETTPCAPISNYAASKLAGEAYCQSYASTYGLRVTILRYANVFGERAARGVMRDFYLKLKKAPARLEILGDGNQEKSYIYIADAVAATLIAWKKQKNNCDAVGGYVPFHRLGAAGVGRYSLRRLVPAIDSFGLGYRALFSGIGKRIPVLSAIQARPVRL